VHLAVARDWTACAPIQVSTNGWRPSDLPPPLNARRFAERLHTSCRS
jgi:hypothetical protein